MPAQGDTGPGARPQPTEGNWGSHRLSGLMHPVTRAKGVSGRIFIIWHCINNVQLILSIYSLNCILYVLYIYILQTIFTYIYELYTHSFQQHDEVESQQSEFDGPTFTDEERTSQRREMEPPGQAASQSPL